MHIGLLRSKTVIITIAVLVKNYIACSAMMFPQLTSLCLSNSTLMNLVEEYNDE